MDIIFVAVGFILVLLLGIGLGWLLVRKSHAKSAAQTEIRSELTELRSIGELSAFRVVTKDILTHTDHSFGDFGRRYLKWAFSQKKLAMVFEFETDFRFDLRDPSMKIETGVLTPQGGRFVHLTLPVCRANVLMRDLSFYDEQRSKLLPWLLPDLINGFLPTGLSEADKNQLIASARQHAQTQGSLLLERYRRDIDNSAIQTLTPILKALGAREIRIEFAKPSPVAPGDVTIDAHLLDTAAAAAQRRVA
jgi:hypothetical protein